MSILSAGFGLITNSIELPSYNATFAANIERVPTPFSNWWTSVCHSQLPGTSILDFVKSHPDDRFIFCVSSEYLNAIQNDLFDALNQLQIEKERLVIIASKIPKKLEMFDSYFLNASRNILHHPKAQLCGLALTDRNIVTIATYLFSEQLTLTNATFDIIIPTLNKEWQSLAPPVRPTRTKRDDDFILAYIENKLKMHGNLSQAKLFKQYKEDGNACLDKRFRALYNQIKLTKVPRD